MTIEEMYQDAHAEVSEKIAALRSSFYNVLHGGTGQTRGVLRAYARLDVDIGEALYKKRGNPLSVWAAIVNAETAGIPLPEWVLVYLRKTAHAFLNIQSGVVRERRPARIAEALGLKPRGAGRQRDAYEALHDDRDFLVADAFRDARLSHTYKEALDIISKAFGVKARVIERAWQKYFGKRHNTQTS